jgi:hypothetical protein
MSVDPGYSVSHDGRDDWMAYRYVIGTWNPYENRIQWASYNWKYWYQAPGFGGMSIPRWSRISEVSSPATGAIGPANQKTGRQMDLKCLRPRPSGRGR